jgi:hypothetical protein
VETSAVEVNIAKGNGYSDRSIRLKVKSGLGGAGEGRSRNATKKRNKYGRIVKDKVLDF